MSVGYGRDLSCVSGLATGRMVRGKTLLAEAIVRRLTTPRGTLYGGDEESSYGIDLAAYVGVIGGDVAAAALPAVIESELMKDDRIGSVEVDVSTSTVAGLIAYRVALRVIPADATEDFALTLSVSSVSVDVLGGMP